MRSICFVLSLTGNYTSHEPLRAIASLVSYPSWLFLQIPSHGPFYYLTSLHRSWDGGICALSGVSAGKTALRAGKEFAAMLKCIFVWASLMGVDKQHMCADTFALLLHWTSKVTHFSRFFAFSLLFVASLQYCWPMQLFMMSVREVCLHRYYRDPKTSNAWPIAFFMCKNQEMTRTGLVSNSLVTFIFALRRSVFAGHYQSS